MKLAVFVGLTLCCLPAWSSVLETESFSYSLGQTLNGLNGGTGWSGAWQTPGGLDATTSSGLAFSGLSVSGGAVSTAGFQPPNQGASVATFVRSLGANIGADNTTAFVSFLMRPDAGSGFYGGLNVGNLFAGLSGNQATYGLEGPTNDLSLSNLGAIPGQTVFFVLRLDFLPGNDTVSLFLNPAPGQPPPGTASAVKTDLDVGAVTSIVINNYGGYTLDEIRIGTTYADVTPLSTESSVPEPRFGLGVGLFTLLGLLVRQYWIGRQDFRVPEHYPGARLRHGRILNAAFSYLRS